MFGAISKDTGTFYTVFDVCNNKFLVYANGYFQYVHMDKFYVDTHKYGGTNAPKENRDYLFKRTTPKEEVI